VQLLYLPQSMTGHAPSPIPPEELCPRFILGGGCVYEGVVVRQQAGLSGKNPAWSCCGDFVVKLKLLIGIRLINI
jgi:hypothetical protein